MLHLQFVPSGDVRASLAALLMGGLLATTGATSALAHAVCGARVFPATLVIDDPGQSDELSLPTVQYTPIPASGGNPSGHIVDYGYEYDKNITRDLGFAINGDYVTQRGAGQSLNGWDNITVTLKDELPCFEDDELMFSVGVVREFAKTGAARLIRAGVIDGVSSTAPTLYAGKGFGDLPIGYLRPFAVTAEYSYQISDSPGASPNESDYGFSLQYSMPYMQQQVKALNIPDFFTHLVPLIEVSLSSPQSGPTTGTISPGFLYEGRAFQVGVEAVIPANGATRQTQGTGVIVQFHVFLDDLFYKSIGGPLFNVNLWGEQ
jgi:hypothetical protein